MVAPDDAAAPGRDRYARTFDVLELLAGHSDGMTVTEISKRLELPISSSHNLLQRMVSAEVVNVTEDLRYSLGPRAVRLGIRITDGLEVRAVARRHLQELARSTGEDVYLAVRLGRRITYVDRVPGSRPITVEIRLGQGLFLHATAVGKLFAAHSAQLRQRLFSGEPLPTLTERTLTETSALTEEFERIRSDGFSVSREEGIVGVVGLAVPIRDSNGELVAAVHISALRAQFTSELERSLLKAAASTAIAIERELGRAEAPGASRGLALADEAG